MTDSSLDGAYNYGGGGFGSVGSSGALVQRLQSFRNSLGNHNSGLPDRIMAAAGQSAERMESMRQQSKTTRLGMKQAHAMKMLRESHGLGAEQIQSTGKGDFQVKFRDPAPEPKPTRSRTAAKPAAEKPAPAAAKTARTRAASGTAKAVAKATGEVAKTVRTAMETKTGAASGQRSTKAAAAKAAPAKPAVTAKPRAQRSSG